MADLRSQFVTSRLEGVMNKESKDIKSVSINDYIYSIRGSRVMLDADLAALYGVEVKVLNQQVKRNKARFPEDFMFQLASEEVSILRSQFVTSSSWGGRRHLPYAFTEQGIAMLSSVLKSPRAIQVNIHIMRAFVAMRRYAVTHEELAKKIDALEGKYDKQFAVVFEALKHLMEPPSKPTKRIGFLSEERTPYRVFN
jgi:hypothetical protein